MLFSAHRTRPRLARLSLSGSILLLVLCGAESARADVAISESARKHFSAGVSYLQDPDGPRYEEAYREFKAAYGESASWKILGNLGLAAMKLERDGEAIDAYREYLRQGAKDIDAEERAQVQRDLDTLQAGVVTITIETVPAGALVTDERLTVRGDRVVNLYGPTSGPLKLGIRPGHHRLKASLSGYTDEAWEFEARSGAAESHIFQLKAPEAVTTAPLASSPPPVTSPVSAGSPPPESMQRPVPTGVYIGLVATGAFAIGATVTGLMANSKHSDFEDVNDGSDPGRAKDLRDRGKTLNLVTDVLLGGAVVAAGVTTVLYLTRPTLESRQSAYTLVPVAGPHGGGLFLSSRF